MGIGFNVNFAFLGTQNFQGISSEDQLLYLCGVRSEGGWEKWGEGEVRERRGG